MVWALAVERKSARRYSFQARIRTSRKVATSPGWRAAGRSEEDPVARRAVERRALLQLPRDAGEEVAHQPDDDGQVHRHVGDDQRDAGVEQAELLEQDIDRDAATTGGRMRCEIIQKGMSLLPKRAPEVAARVGQRSSRKKIASAASAASRQSTWPSMTAAERQGQQQDEGEDRAPSRGWYSMRDEAHRRPCCPTSTARTVLQLATITELR